MANLLPLVLATLLRPVGAQVPFHEYEAEVARTTGVVIGPDRRLGSLPTEASGRRAVRLDSAAQELTFTLVGPANAMTIRYSIPDDAKGGGKHTILGILVGKRQIASASLTSAYGWFYGRYPFTNNPEDGAAHHFFDEVRVRLPDLLPAGTQVTLRRTSDERVPWVIVDLIDAERVGGPIQRPRDSLNVVDFGADASGARDSAKAFDLTLEAARRTRKIAYIPQGTFRIDRHLIVDRATLKGAGAWYTTLRGDGIGLWGRTGPRPSAYLVLEGFAIEGSVKERRDDLALAAIGGTMNHSRLTNLYLHHTKVGVWLDGPMHDLSIRDLRIADQMADGINLHRGVSDAVIANNFIRNTGDDGIALWSDRQANRHITIRDNSVAIPVLANGIALYGGHDLSVRRNLVTDTVTEGGGIHIGTRFHSTAFSGWIDVVGNQLTRTGSFDPNWKRGVGAIWFYALERPISGARILVRDNDIASSTCESITLMGPHKIGNIIFDPATWVTKGVTSRDIVNCPLVRQEVSREPAPGQRLRCPAFAQLRASSRANPSARSLLRCRSHHGSYLGPILQDDRPRQRRR